MEHNGVVRMGLIQCENYDPPAGSWHLDKEGQIKYRKSIQNCFVVLRFQPLDNVKHDLSAAVATLLR